MESQSISRRVGQYSDPQGGDGREVPLRLFIYAGCILPGGEAYLKAVWIQEVLVLEYHDHDQSLLVVHCMELL